MTRRLVVHLGCSKTGTSSLQAGLWDSVEALSQAGVGLPFRDREEHLDHLLRPLGWRPVEAYGGPRDEAALAALPDRIRATPGRVLLASNEDLAEIDRAGAETLAAAAEADTELHLMITVRGWALQLPSEYQQFLKHRMTLGYADFLTSVRERDGIWARRFRDRQDTVGLVERFAGLVPPERIHVVPIGTADPETIFTATAGLLDVDAGVIARPGRAVNTSFGAVEAEVFRRVTLALESSEALPTYTEFARAVRRPFVRGVLPHGASTRLRLPPEHLDWVAAGAEEALTRLVDLGVDLHGGAEALGSVLRPRPDQCAPIPEVDEAEVARVAVATLARYAVYQAERRQAPASAPVSAPARAGRRWWRG